jgi:DNA polymerase III epsilon subunit-like protein
MGAYLKTIILDFESFFSQDYSLRKMTPVEYILDPRFECIGAAVKEESDAPYWVDGDDLPLFFADLAPQETCIVSHNASFDMAITAWRYGFVPRLMVDTLGVARACLGHKLKSLSLASVAQELGIGVKGGAIHKVVGMGAAAIKQAGLYDEYIQYAMNDAELCAAIYERLVKSRVFPVSELVVMDMVLRCAVQPQFLLDQHVLAEHLHKIRADKEALLARVGVNKDELMSNDKFAQALAALGVDPPRKTSLVTGKETWAFAKTDPEFIALEEHEDEAVQSLVAARLGHKSTLEETRTETFLRISNLTWPGNATPRMPMPLRYSGAHTHRLSGDWGMNVQNMPRGGALRRALIAPSNHLVLAADASQIEARIVAWLCGQEDLVQQFANGEDVYSSFASKVFERPINKKTDPAERFIGKTAILGLGYGLGWAKFQRTVKMQSKAQTGQTIELSDHEAQKIVDTYRTGYSKIPATWRLLNNNIDALISGREFTIGPCQFEKGAIKLPSGLKLHYHKLTSGDDGWSYEYGGKPKRLYGGALLENCIAEGTEVLTDRGWVLIENVTAEHKVHDGVEFVAHRGLVGRGVQACVSIEGVFMTPDHEVLTDDGWKAASQEPQPYRPDLRHVDGCKSVSSVGSPGRYKQVYDIVNAGPRRRFVVRGDRGPFIVHNCVQALARIVVMDAAVRLRKLLAPMGVQLALQVHDELVFVVPEQNAEICKQLALQEMARRPVWAPTLPLDAEADVGPSYGDAK